MKRMAGCNYYERDQAVKLPVYLPEEKIKPFKILWAKICQIEGSQDKALKRMEMSYATINKMKNKKMLTKYSAKKILLRYQELKNGKR